MIKNLSVCNDKQILTQIVEPSFRHGLPESSRHGWHLQSIQSANLSPVDQAHLFVPDLSTLK